MDKDSIELVVDGLSVAAASASAIVALIALVVQLRLQTKTLKKLDHQIELQNHSHKIQALNDLIMNKYYNRQFARDPIIIIEGQQCDFFRSRSKARQLFRAEPSKWEKDCAAATTHDWQFIVANEISHSLQDIGIAALTGSVPLKLLLPMLGDYVILDWLITKKTVEMLRKEDGLYSSIISGYNLYAILRYI